MRHIGIFGDSLHEIANRPFSGALSYAQEVGSISIRDFCTPGERRNVCGTQPPWKNQIDGVIVTMGRDKGATDTEMAEWVLGGRVPAVAVGSDWIDSRIPCVHVDFEALANVAAEHLIHCGCKSFLFLGYAGSAGSLKRARAFKHSLAQRGRKLTEHATTHALFGLPEDAVRLRSEPRVLETLRKLHKPIGVWALNDYFAATLCDVVRELGFAIPEEVKVLGVDDIAIARCHRPALSSIRTPGEEIGRLAMHLLQQLLDDQVPRGREIQVPPVGLLERESTLGGMRFPVNVADTLDYIAQHACVGLTVEHLADILDLSRRSLELHFRSVTGHSPQEEIQRVKLQRAKELLLRSDFSVTRIASMVGFAETAAFSKFFRNQTGLSPRAFRQSQN